MSYIRRVMDMGYKTILLKNYLSGIEHFVLVSQIRIEERIKRIPHTCRLKKRRGKEERLYFTKPKIK